MDGQLQYKVTSLDIESVLRRRKAVMHHTRYGSSMTTSSSIPTIVEGRIRQDWRIRGVPYQVHTY